MIRWLIRSAISLVTLCVAAYFFFFVPLGRRTVFEHVVRISQTDEAQDFGREIGDATDRLSDDLGQRVEAAGQKDEGTQVGEN